MYTDFNAGNKDYKLKLSVNSICELEKRIGKNPVALFGFNEDNPEIATVTEMIAVLWASLQDLHHGISFGDAKEIFQEWLDDGHTPTDFIKVITDIYRASGIFKNDKKDKNDNTEKN